MLINCRKWAADKHTDRHTVCEGALLLLMFGMSAYDCFSLLYNLNGNLKIHKYLALFENKIKYYLK